MADYPIPGVGNDFTTQNFTTQARQLSSESLRPAGMGNASADLSTTLRSFRDSLAFSFQTLNLTLNSLNNSVRTVGTKLGATDIHLYNQSQYLRTSPPGVWLGAMNPAYAQFAGNQSLVGMMTANVPYNVSPMEFWQNRAQEMGYRFSSAGINAIGTGAEVGAGLAGTLLGGPAIARAIGFGSSRMAGLMLGGPVGMLAGTVVGAVADPMIRVAQEHNRDVAALQRMSARFSTGGFNTRQAQQAMTGIEDLAYNEIFNTNSLQPRLNMSGFRELTNMGLQGGLFHGTNPDDLVKQVSAAANVVKFLTGVMGNKDVQETMQLVKQMKDMGVNLFHANNFAMGLGTDAFKYGRAMGINPNDMMNMAANMSTVAFGQYGNPAYVGMQPAMRNLAYMQELEKRGALTPAEIAAGGGVQTMATRMLSAQAALLNSGNFGMPMLAAGFTRGGGFSVQQFQNAIGRGGYFGAIGMAANNMFRDGLYSIADIMANQTNAMDALARGDYMDEALLTMLRQALSLTPGMNESGRVGQDKTNLAAVYLQQFLRSAGADIDMGTAKAMAARIYMPQYAQATQNAANNAYRIGMMEEQRALRSPGRFFESIGEGVERKVSSIWHNIIQRPARGLADALTNIGDFSYANNMATVNPVGANDIRNYLWAERTLRETGYQSQGLYTAEEVRDATRLVTGTDTDSMAHFNARNRNYFASLFAGRDFNRLEDAIATNQRTAYADVWNRIGSSNRMTKSQAVASGAYLFRNDATIADFERYFESQTNSSAQDPLSSAARAMWGLQGRDRSLTKSAENVRDLLDSRLRGEDVASAILTEADRNAGGFENGRFTNLFADDVLSYLQRDPASRQRIAKYTEEYNRKYNDNRTVDQMTGYLARRLAGQQGSIGSRGSRISDVYLAGSTDVMKNLAEGFSSLENASQWMGQEGMGGIDFNPDKAYTMMQNLGISEAEISELLTEDGKAIDKLGALIDKNNKGEKFTLADLPSKDLIKTKAGRRILSLLEEQNKNGEVWYNARFGSLFASSEDRVTGSGFRGALAAITREQNFQNINASLNNLGIDLTQEEMSEALNSDKGLAGYLANIDPKTKAQADLKQYATRVANMNSDQLNEALKGKLDPDNKLTDAQKMSYLVGNQGNISAAQEQGTINRAFTKKKSAIDSAVANDTGEPYVRVKMVADSAKDARGDLTKDTGSSKVSKMANPSKVAGVTTFTPGQDTSFLPGLLSGLLG